MTIRAETERIRVEGEMKRLEMELAIQRERLQGENRWKELELQILQLQRDVSAARAPPTADIKSIKVPQLNEEKDDIDDYTSLSLSR